MNEEWRRSKTIQRLHHKSAGELSRWALKHRFAALLGPRHSGKTHILQITIQSIATRPGWAALLLSLYELQGDAYTTEEFFGMVLTQIKEKLLLYHPGLTKSERYQQEDKNISPPLFCSQLNKLVQQMGRDLYIAFDHLETLPEFLASELLQALRTFSSQPAGIPRVVTVVTSTLPITNLSTGEISPYYNIAEQLYVGDLSEQDNLDIITELLPDASDELRKELLGAAHGDLELLIWICKSCEEKASEDGREVPSVNDLRQAISEFLVHEARTHPVFEEAQKRIATSPRLLSCMADLTGDRQCCFPDSETRVALRLTGLVSRNADGSYSLRNELYREFLHKQYSPEKLGRLLAVTGDWESGTDLLIKHYSEYASTDDAQPMLDFAITAAFVADSLEEAVSLLTRVLEAAFPVRNPRFWLQSTHGASLRYIPCLGDPASPEDDIKKDDLRPEARVWKTGNVLTSVSGEQATFPLSTHSTNRIGVVTLHQWRKMMQTAEWRKRIDDLRDFLYKAARPLSLLIDRAKQEAERSLLERELPLLIGNISRLAKADTLPQDVLRLLADSRVLPFRRAAIQLLNAKRDNLEVCAYTEHGNFASSGPSFPVPLNHEKIPAGRLNVRVLKQGEAHIWHSRSSTLIYANQSSYLTWEVKGWIGVPLIANSEKLGVLTLYNDQTGEDYSEKHIVLAHQIADSTAGRIFEARQSERMRQERLLLRNITASMQDLEKTRTNIIEGTMRLTGAESGNIGLVDRDRNQITIPTAMVRNAQGEPIPMQAEQLRAFCFSATLDSGIKSIMTYVAANRRSENIPDVRAGKWRKIYKPLHDETLSELAVPVFDPVTNEVVGIINLESSYPNAFRQEDCRLLEELSVHVFFAVNNAKLYKLLRAASLRSAVTAIMARNMSHNIGSHSLSYLSTKGALSRLISTDSSDTSRSEQLKKFTANLNVEELTANLNGYIRERMDFIASIPTLNPTWTMPLDLMESVFNPVWGQEGCDVAPLFLLLNTIARSERIYAPDLRLNVCIRDDRQPDVQEMFTYGFEYQDGSLIYRSSQTHQVSNMPCKIAVFMGTTGLQAMYGLLENFIRNSAKHSPEERVQEIRKQTAPSVKTARMAKALNVTLEFTYNCDCGKDSALSDLVRLRIYDSMGGWDDKTGTKINNNLDSFLDPEGRLVEGYWGLKEMRICASFLRGLTIAEYEAVHDPPILKAEAHATVGIGDSLGYVLYLPRVKECLILGAVSYSQQDTSPNDDWANQGVYLADTLEALDEMKRHGSFNHAAVVIGTGEVSPGPKSEAVIANIDFVKEFLRNPTHFPAKTLLATPNADVLNHFFNAEQSSIALRNAVCYINEKQILQAIFPSDLSGNRGDTVPAAWEALQSGEQAVAAMRVAWLQKQMGLTVLPKLQIIDERNKDNNQRTDGWANLLAKRPNELDGTVILNHAWDSLEQHPDLLKVCRFYAPYRSSPANALNGLVYTMTRSESLDFERLSAYLELLEAALTNVIVIDERIFSDSRDRRYLQGMDDVLLNSYLALQNVAVFNIPQKGTLAGIARIEPIIDKKGSTPAPHLRQFTASKLASALQEYVPAHFASQVHFLVLHHTILQNKLGGHENLERFLDEMGVYRPRWVVITSGRGRPDTEMMPRDARFLEYSNLRRFTIQDTDKTLLSRMLWSLKDG